MEFFGDFELEVVLINKIIFYFKGAYGKGPRFFLGGLIWADLKRMLAEKEKISYAVDSVF